MNALEVYLDLGKRLGCPVDQMRNFRRAELVLQERQLMASAAARMCDWAGGPSSIGYGGARGGGGGAGRRNGFTLRHPCH